MSNSEAAFVGCPVDADSVLVNAFRKLGKETKIKSISFYFAVVLCMGKRSNENRRLQCLLCVTNSFNSDASASEVSTTSFVQTLVLPQCFLRRHLRHNCYDRNSDHGCSRDRNPGPPPVGTRCLLRVYLLEGSEWNNS